jgi:hypothetical protein
MKHQARRTSNRIISGLAGALLLLNLGPVRAGQSPTQPWFTSELEAVIAATEHYNPVSVRQDREFMGAVLRTGDRYSYTVGAGEPGRDKVTVTIRISDGADLVAFWHTHGARAESNRYFSDVDTQLVKRWQKPFYLADYTGYLKVMVPGGRTLSARRARRLGLPARTGYAVGQLVNDAHGDPVRILTRE